MSLEEKKFLFIDCQTTGMHPSNGHLLEISWLAASAQTAHPEIQSYLVQLPEGDLIPKAIQKITGLSNEDLSSALPLEMIFAQFAKTLEKLPNDTIALIHYAQFEKAFLKDLFMRHQLEKELPFEILCTAKISRKIFPHMTSGNIRAVSGFIGSSVGLKRAASHVQATFEIWQEIVKRLERQSITSIDQMKSWLAEPKTTDPEVKFEYHIDRLTRLALPDRPGVYRMFNKKNEILYVGKATSLKSRVNSYFRVKKKAR